MYDEELEILGRWNLKTQHSPIVLDLRLRKIQSVKSRDYYDVIMSHVLEKLRFENVYRPHETETSAFSNSSSLKSKSLRFRYALVWTVGLTVQI